MALGSYLLDLDRVYWIVARGMLEARVGMLGCWRVGMLDCWGVGNTHVGGPPWNVGRLEWLKINYLHYWHIGIINYR